MEFVKINIKEINKIKNLWEKLNEHHEKNSINFKHKFKNFKFEDRIKHFKEKVKNGFYQIEVVKDLAKNQLIGFCLSSVVDNVGEIDSIYILNEYRGNNIGDRLIKSSLKFFEKNKAKKIF